MKNIFLFFTIILLTTITHAEEINKSENIKIEHSANNDLKKIEEEFDLGESTNDEQDSNISSHSNPQKDQEKFFNQDNEENFDLETILAANYYKKATLLVTNKITAKSQLLTINVGSSEFFGNIEIFPLKCWKSSNKYNPESKAFVNIIERKIDDESKNIFKGWLFSSSISLSTMQHPIYEISIVDCTGDKISIKEN